MKLNKKSTVIQSYVDLLNKDNNYFNSNAKYLIKPILGQKLITIKFLNNIL